MTGRPPLWRRRFVVDSFQYRLLGITLTYFLAAVVVFVAAIFVPLIVELWSRGALDADDAALADQFLVLHGRVWPAVGVAVLMLTVHSVVTSNRIAGPLYRFRQVFEAVARGDLTGRVRIRSHDYLDRDADALDAMVEALAEHVARLRRHQELVRQRAARLRGAVATAEDRAIDEAMDELDEALGASEAALARFAADGDVAS